MTPDKIVAVITRYERRLRDARVPQVRMDPKRTFGSLSKDEHLAHAHFLCGGAKLFARDPDKYDKANRHLTAIQMCLSCADWYTLGELMDHNRPKKAAKMTARK